MSDTRAPHSGRTLKDYRPQHDEDCEQVTVCATCGTTPNGWRHGPRNYGTAAHSFIGKPCTCGLDRLLAGDASPASSVEATQPVDVQQERQRAASHAVSNRVAPSGADSGQREYVRGYCIEAAYVIGGWSHIVTQANLQLAVLYGIGASPVAEVRVTAANWTLDEFTIPPVLTETLVQAEQGWQPIESAPKDGTHVLVCDASRPFTLYWTFDMNPPTVGHYHGGGWHLSVNRDGEQSEISPTHWMPLPDPPSALAVSPPVPPQEEEHEEDHARLGNPSVTTNGDQRGDLKASSIQEKK